MLGLLVRCSVGRGRLDSVEWNGGMDYWNGILECPTYYCAVLKSTVAERTSTARRTIVHNIMFNSGI